MNRANNFYHSTHGQHLLHKQAANLTQGAYPQAQTTTLPGINPQQSLQGGNINDRHHDASKRRPSSFNEFQRSNQGSQINSPAGNYTGVVGMSQNLQSSLGSS